MMGRMKMLTLPVLCLLLAGCGTTIYSVRIPLTPDPAAGAADAPNVFIDDQRPAGESITHTGRGRFSCARWYGDDTFQPPKLAALDQLIAARVPGNVRVHVELHRFDTIEYCENTANAGGAAAAAGASAATGNPIHVPATRVPGGDSVHLRLAGSINGAPFDVQRVFDYEGLRYKFGEMPSANPRYRELLWKCLGELADEIVAQPPMVVPQ